MRLTRCSGRRRIDMNSALPHRTLFRDPSGGGSSTFVVGCRNRPQLLVNRPPKQLSG
jgi:hypothetical protein